MPFTTGKVRISFPHLFTPSAVAEGGQEKYSVVMLIDKNDKETLAKIADDVEIAKKKYIDKNGKLPFKDNGPKMPTVMHDGDGLRPNGEEFGPECAGHWVMRASTTMPPVVINRAKEPIENPQDVYPGCYCMVSAACGVYATGGNKGITCYLNGVAKIEDGEPLAGTSPAATQKSLEEALDSAYTDDDLFGTEG